MNRVEALIKKYGDYVSLTWENNLSGNERVWFAVYDKSDERRIRARVEEFDLATQRANHDWKLVDLTDAFAQWIAAHKYRDSYFEAPEDLDLALSDFKHELAERLRAAFKSSRNSDNTVVAVQGVAGLFSFMKVSELIDEIEKDIRGRLLVFFPGIYENNNYRLLDARDGWNYMAVPIMAEVGE